MIMEIIDPITGKPFHVEAVEISLGDIEQLRTFHFSAEALRAQLDQLNLSADTKLILFKLADFTVRVGNVILKIGKKVLDVALQLFSSYPHTGFGIILGGVLGILIAFIPVLGPPLSSLLTPIMMVMGMLHGFSRDALSSHLQDTIHAELRKNRN